MDEKSGEMRKNKGKSNRKQQKILDKCHPSGSKETIFYCLFYQRLGSQN